MDIYRTISEIEATSSHAEYHSANVTDAEAISSAVGGRSVTGIVHGGLEEPNWLQISPGAHST